MRWKVGARRLVARIVAEQVLRAQIVAHLRRGLVQAALVHVKMLAAGLLGQVMSACSPPVSRPALASMGTSMME